MDMGKKNKKGDVSWHTHGVMGIIKNEKYKGDILLGKTFTTDPISKRRLANMGEEEQYYGHIFALQNGAHIYLLRRSTSFFPLCGQKLPTTRSNFLLEFPNKNMGNIQNWIKEGSKSEKMKMV